MSTWTCDGVPKNGKQYPGLGGDHPPRQNHYLDCEECGLPRESQEIQEPTPTIPLKPIMLASIVGLGILSGLYLIFVRFNKTSDEQYTLIYQEAVNIGQTGQSIVDNHKSLQQLKEAEGYFSNAINKLQEIPEQHKIYQEVEKTIDTYRELLIEINNKVSNPSNTDMCSVAPKPKYCIF